MDAYWGWWIVAAVLAGAELVTNTFYLLAIAVALAAGGVAAFLGLSSEWQWALAVALGIALTFVAHRWRTRRLQPTPQEPADIGNSVRVILDSDYDPAELFRDETATERTVEESLRICAPVHIFQRWALEPAEIDGIEFKRGDKVSMILAAANLDPAKFSDPLAFKPDRNEAPNLSFGAGIHFCIGAPLARLELNVVLPILFKRLPGLKLAKTPVVKDVYHFHGLDRLDLVC